MENTSTNKSNKENHQPVELLNLATIAAQMMEDIEHIYGQAVQRKVREIKRTEIGVSAQSPNEEGSWFSRITGKIRTYPILRSFFLKRGCTSEIQSSELPIPKNGELFIIATRSKDLRAEIQLQLVHHISTHKKQPIIIFSASDSFILFTRKLAGLIADIPADAAIYDGKLNEAELMRLRSALAELMAANVFMYPGIFGLDEVCNAPRKLHKQIDTVSMVLVDAVQYLMDNQRRSIDIQTSFIELKVLANELRAPVIALYQLDPTVEEHPVTLTRYELGEVEALNELTDGLMLMSGTREKLVFATPKILKAKPVEWVDQISSVTWHQQK